MTTPTQEAIARVRELMADATPSPWHVLGNQGTALWAGDSIIASHHGARKLHRLARADALFIAAAINALPAILAAAEEAEGLRAALVDAVAFLEMDTEANKPGTDLYAWIDAARALTAAPLQTTGDTVGVSNPQPPRSADSTGKAG